MNGFRYFVLFVDDYTRYVWFYLILFYGFLGLGCFPLLGPYNRNKLQFRSAPFVFLGYPESFRGDRCMDVTTNKVFICRHVRFDESIYLFFLYFECT